MAKLTDTLTERISSLLGRAAEVLCRQAAEAVAALTKESQLVNICHPDCLLSMHGANFRIIEENGGPGVVETVLTETVPNSSMKTTVLPPIHDLSQLRMQRRENHRRQNRTSGWQSPYMRWQNRTSGWQSPYMRWRMRTANMPMPTSAPDLGGSFD